MSENGTEKPSKKHKTLCHICNKYITGNSYCFKAHLYKHNVTKPRFSCSLCNKKYFRKDVYDKHMEVHTGRRRVFICDYCDRNFVDKRNLITHLKIHDDDLVTPTRFTCKACGNAYCEERLLKYHIRKEHFNLQHKDDPVDKKPINKTWIENVIMTDTCAQMTKINNNVISIKKCKAIKQEKEHQEVNTNETFVNYINSVFGRNDKSHYSKAICDYCNKEMLKKSLLNHIRESHLNVRKFKCEVCQRTFNRHYQLTNHICGKKVRRSWKTKLLTLT